MNDKIIGVIIFFSSPLKPQKKERERELGRCEVRQLMDPHSSRLLNDVLRMMRTGRGRDDEPNLRWIIRVKGFPTTFGRRGAMSCRKKKKKEENPLADLIPSFP